MWKWQKKMPVLSGRVTAKWHLFWGIEESGPAERWSGTVGAISVFGYQWGTLILLLTPQDWIVYETVVSLIFPHSDHLFHPLCTPPALCWHKCLRSHAVNPAEELVQAKIALFLSLSLLVPLTLVSPPAMRGEHNWLFWQRCRLIVIHENLVSDCLV